MTLRTPQEIINLSGQGRYSTLWVAGVNNSSSMARFFKADPHRRIVEGYSAISAQ